MRCDKCKKETDDLESIWDMKLCKECRNPQKRRSTKDNRDAVMNFICYCIPFIIVIIVIFIMI